MQPMPSESPADSTDLEKLERLREGYQRIHKELSKVIVGQKDVLEKIVVALFAGGHSLLIGVPGLAKTLMVRTLAQTLSWDFRRIQFTPDLMPSDITGTEIIREDRTTGERSLVFVHGPIFANLILADEINRTPPRTQAALLEAMQEYQVTAGGKTYHLDPPFFVLATQNPIEQEGTYPLPEAQLDRFMFSIRVDYPTVEEEEMVVTSTTSRSKPVAAKVFDKGEVLDFQDLVRGVPVSPHVVKYATALARASRPRQSTGESFINDYVEWGAGPRASQYLILGAKARAVLYGKVTASCADVQAVAHPVLEHRIIPNYRAAGEGISSADIINRLLQAVPQPKYE
jgi:MoxR-like ATPase